MSITHRPKSGDKLTGTEYEAEDAHLVELTAADVGAAADDHDHDAAYDVTGTATAAVNAHEGASDPHTGYRKESDDHSHASSGAQGGQVSHANLSSVSANQHHNQAHALNSADHTGAFDSVPLGTVSVFTGSGDPEGNQTAPAGSLYLRTTGLTYIKGSGSGNTGWLEIVTIG